MNMNPNHSAELARMLRQSRGLSSVTSTEGCWDPMLGRAEQSRGARGPHTKQHLQGNPLIQYVRFPTGVSCSGCLQSKQGDASWEPDLESKVIFKSEGTALPSLDHLWKRSALYKCSSLSELIVLVVKKRKKSAFVLTSIWSEREKMQLFQSCLP